MTAEQACLCWRLPAENGDVLPLTWVCLHDEVRVATNDGRRAQGYSTGGDWWGPSPPEPMIQVESDDGDLAVSLAEVQTITPVGGCTDSRDFERKVAAAIANANLLPPRHETHLRFLSDEHTTLLVTVTRETHRCSPGPEPSASGRLEQ